MKKAPCEISVSLKVRTVFWVPRTFTELQTVSFLLMPRNYTPSRKQWPTAGTGVIFLECKIWLLERLEVAFSVLFKGSNRSCDFVNVSLYKSHPGGLAGAGATHLMGLESVGELLSEDF